MKITDLDLRDLLDFAPQGGLIHFAGERVLLLDAVALGLLRKELIETLGETIARGVLTRFGYSHGWRTAESLRDAFPWDNEREWRIAGGRLHALRGWLIREPVPHAASDKQVPYAESIWRESYEAEQHLLHFGLADGPVCWTLCGFASGYFAFCTGREIYALEERCRGKGDSFCRMVARSREEWGEQIRPYLSFYRNDSLDTSLQVVTMALKRAESCLHRRQQRLTQSLGDDGDTRGIITRNVTMQRVLDLAQRVASADTSVLILGESGVGKERLARFIHQESPRAGGPFVAINCAALPESLLESELFGHARGAFTGATQDRPGLFEVAIRGSLFLDEVGDMSPAMQVRVLRVLQEREVRRVGEQRTRPIDVRIIAATNRELSQEVTAGRFRQDLYYRLRVVEHRLPPLRERKEDILLLARAFLSELATRFNRHLSGFTPQAADQLVRYDWPGNVRELHNVIERAVILAERGHVEVEDLPDEVRYALPTVCAPPLIRSLATVEKEYILAVLQANNGHLGKTAEQLDIGTATLYRKLRQYKHSRP